METIRNAITDIIFFGYERFFIGLEHASTVLQTDMLQNANVAATVENIQRITSGVAYSIMTILFMLSFFTLLQKDDVSERDLFKILITLFISRTMIYYAPELLKLILSTGTYWISEMSQSLDASVNESLMESVRQSIYDSLPVVSQWGVIGAIISIVLQVLSLILYLPNFLIMLAGYLIIEAIAYGRNIEIVVLISASTIPIAFLPYEGTKEITKKFILSLAAVTLQGVFILMIIQIFLALLESTTDIWGITVLSVVVCLGIAKASSWAKEVLGLA